MRKVEMQDPPSSALDICDMKQHVKEVGCAQLRPAQRFCSGQEHGRESQRVFPCSCSVWPNKFSLPEQLGALKRRNDAK